MKASEIQIGDWIEWMGNKCKVDLPLLMTEYQDNIDSNNVKPIPLTTEILEKNGYYGLDNTRGINGFIGDESDITIANVGNGNFDLDIYLNTWTNDSCVRIDIKYVHELQHALRLCGLNELADNFKIE